MPIRVIVSSVLCLISLLFVPVLSAQTTGADKAAVSSTGYFIVTRRDVRKCAFPKCGGYFVQLLNQKRTRCADGTALAECHAASVDFSPSGLDPDSAAKFESELLATGHGLVRGRLALGNVGPATRVETLVVTEAWAGQANVTPSGAFFRLTDRGIVCIKAPCPTYLGERLNTNLTRTLNSIDLSKSGAPQSAIELALAELRDPGILGAGSVVQSGRSSDAPADFTASEFYVRIKLARDRCAALDATGSGTCAQVLGYAWDGAVCEAVSGCACKGADCAALVKTIEECQKAHGGCAGALCGSRGIPPCSNDQYCDYNPEAKCGTFDAPGVCVPRPQVCNKIYSPVCGCDGVTYANACEAHAAGVDDATAGACTK